MSSLVRSTSDSSSFALSFNSKPSKSLSSLLVCPITLYHSSRFVSLQPPFYYWTQKKSPLLIIPFSRIMAHINESQTKDISRRKEVWRQIMLICINTMGWGIANLGTGYSKPNFAGSGGPSGILKMDWWRVLVGLLSGIGWISMAWHFSGTWVATADQTHCWQIL